MNSRKFVCQIVSIALLLRYIYPERDWIPLSSSFREPWWINATRDGFHLRPWGKRRLLLHRGGPLYLVATAVDVLNSTLSHYVWYNPSSDTYLLHGRTYSTGMCRNVSFIVLRMITDALCVQLSLHYRCNPRVTHLLWGRLCF